MTPPVPHSDSSGGCRQLPVVLVVAPGEAGYRRYCLDQIAAGYDVVVITPATPTWERAFITDYEVADLSDPAALLAAGRALARRHPIAGVLTWSETHLVPTAELAEHLGLPANPPEVMGACRDKHTARAVFARNNVPSAAFRKVTSLAQAGSAAEAIGYPVVCKPACGAGSVGVIRVDHPDALPAAFAFAAASALNHGPKGSGVLVEEYLDGPEISVECVTHHGVTTAVAVTRKTVGFPPYFEETGHSVDARDPLLPTVAPVAAAAIRALGITTGIQHVEMRLTASGPRLVEVNARIGGDLIGHLVRLATGVDLPRAAADLACGRTPDLTPTTTGAAAIVLLYPPTTGTLTARHLTPCFAEHTPWLRQVHWLREPGQSVTLPPDGDLDTARIGYLIITAPHATELDQRLTTVMDQVTITVAPPAA